MVFTHTFLNKIRKITLGLKKGNSSHFCYALSMCLSVCLYLSGTYMKLFLSENDLNSTKLLMPTDPTKMWNWEYVKIWSLPYLLEQMISGLVLPEIQSSQNCKKYFFSLFERVFLKILSWRLMATLEMFY